LSGGITIPEMPVSLAAKGCIDWFVQWREFGPIEAFTDMPSGVTSKVRTWARGTKVSESDLVAALEIHRARHGGEGPRENLELALRRWIRSGSTGSVPDSLIELRIAVEALYEIGGMNEKGFRIATYGAWHLGADFGERHWIRETLRKAYDDSSRAVHAGQLKHAEKDPGLLSSAQDICRDGILKRLRERKVPNWDELILGARE